MTISNLCRTFGRNIEVGLGIRRLGPLGAAFAFSLAVVCSGCTIGSLLIGLGCWGTILKVGWGAFFSSREEYLSMQRLCSSLLRSASLLVCSSSISMKLCFILRWKRHTVCET